MYDDRLRALAGTRLETLQLAVAPMLNVAEDGLLTGPRWRANSTSSGPASSMPSRRGDPERAAAPAACTHSLTATSPENLLEAVFP